MRGVRKWPWNDLEQLQSTVFWTLEIFNSPETAWHRSDLGSDPTPGQDFSPRFRIWARIRPKQRFFQVFDGCAQFSKSFHVFCCFCDRRSPITIMSGIRRPDRTGPDRTGPCTFFLWSFQDFSRLFTIFNNLSRFIMIFHDFSEFFKFFQFFSRFFTIFHYF